MNKQEAIKVIKDEEILVDNTEYSYGYNEGLKTAIGYVEELDEYEKTVVPQFVADWYEEHKDYLEHNIYDLCNQFREGEIKDEVFRQWFGNDTRTKPIETLVKMKLYGYEVEKEKMYTVELPNPNEPDSGHIVLKKDKNNKVFIDWYYADNWKELDSVKLTEKEIKKDFDWAWQFAEEVKDD